jgi:hypothetical protein
VQFTILAMLRRPYVFCLLLVAVTVSSLHCNITKVNGCYADAPSRPVGNLVEQKSTNDPGQIDLEWCVQSCAQHGYAKCAVTGHPAHPPTTNVGEFYCYCGQTISSKATKVADSNCVNECPSTKSEQCGANGYSTVVSYTCDGPLPPVHAPTPAPQGPRRACSPGFNSFSFCDTSLPLNDRVTDLVNRD